jgi:hypothetical protein
MQQRTHYYDMFSQTVHLKKATSKQTFFCSNAAFICKCEKSADLLEDNFFQKSGTYNLHCCWWPEITIKVLLCNTEYFYKMTDM